MKKKLLAMLLVICMALTLLPVGALALGEDSLTLETPVEVEFTDSNPKNYSFEVAEGKAGLYTFRVTSQTGMAGSLTVTDSKGSKLTEIDGFADNGLDSEGASYSTLWLETGTYTIKVNPQSDKNPTFTLSAEEENCKQLSTLNQSSFTTTSEKDYAYFYFTPESNGWYTFAFSSTGNVSTIANVDIFREADNEGSKYWNKEYYTNDEVSAYFKSQSQRYYIKVSERESNGESFSNGGIVSVAAANFTAITDSQNIELGDGFSYLKYTPTESGTFKIKASASVEAIYGIEIFSVSGDSLASEMDKDASKAVELNYTFQANTTYYIGINGNAEEQKNSATVAVEAVTVSPDDITLDWDSVGIAVESDAAYGMTNADIVKLPSESSVSAVVGDKPISGELSIVDSTAVQDAGERKITAKFKVTDEGIYKDMELSKEYTVTIAPKQITVTMNSITKTYGEALPTEWEYTAGTDVMVGDDTLDLDVTVKKDDAVVDMSKDINAGTYSITAKAKDKVTNYTVTVTAGTLTIDKADITSISSTAKNVEILANSENNTDEKLQDVAQLPETVTVHYGSEKTAVVPVTWAKEGTYEIKGGTYTFTGTPTIAENGNFNETTKTVTVTLTVTPVSLTSISGLDVKKVVTKAALDEMENLSDLVPDKVSLNFDNGVESKEIDAAYNKTLDEIKETDLTDGDADVEIALDGENITGIPEWATVDEDFVYPSCAVTITNKGIIPEEAITFEDAVVESASEYTPEATVSDTETYGEVTFEYTYAKDGVTLDEKPTEGGVYTVTATGTSDSHIGMKTSKLVIRKDISGATVTVTESTYAYDGQEKKPTVSVKDGTTILVQGTDYEVEYDADCTNVGSKTITVTGKGNYKGTATTTFTITKADVQPIADADKTVNLNVGGTKVINIKTDGTVTATSSDSEKATAVVGGSGNDQTVTIKGLAETTGAVNVTISAEAGTNYNALAGTTIAVTVTAKQTTPSIGIPTTPSTPDKTETTTAPDGTTTTTTTKGDGSKEVEVKAPDGTTATAKVDASGKTQAEVQLSATAAAEAEKTSVVLPIPAVPVATSSAAASTVKVSVPASEAGKPMAVTVPTQTSKSGTVAIIVKADGTEQIVKKSVTTKDGLYVPIEGDAQIKIVDNTKSFTDTATHWAGDAINFVGGHELYQGVGENRFDPEGAMNRAMLVTVLHRLEDTPKGGGVSFDDVAAGQYYTDAVAWGAGHGIVQGDGSGFDPNGTVTRQQLATFLYRYAKTVGANTSVTGSMGGFNDAGKVQSWASDAMSWAIGAGLINGKGGGVLDPEGNTTRAEVATILMRFCQYIAE